MSWLGRCGLVVCGCEVWKLKTVGAFSGRIGLPPAVTGWAASCDGGP